MIIEYIIFGILLLVCVLSIYFDFKENRIPNKLILIFIVISIILQTICIVRFYEINLLHYGWCILASFVISLWFYVLKIWAGGDTKLFFLLSLLVPVSVYNAGGYGSIIAIVIIIYSLSFIYIALESMFLVLFGKEKNTVSRERINVISLFVGWISMFSIIGLINNICIVFLGKLYSEYSTVFLFLKVMIILIVGKYVSKIYLPIRIIIILMYIFTFVFFIYGKTVFTFDLKDFLIVSIVFALRIWAGKYNYKKIKVDELKKGMILAASTVIAFLNSDVEGLPLNINEDMSARLKDDDIEKVIEWSKSEDGCEDIYIVRKIPFAIFIAIGFVLYTVRTLIWLNT